MLAVLLLWLAAPGTASGGASGEAPAYDLVGCGVRSIFFQRAYALTLFEDGRGGEVIVLDVLHEGGMPGGLPDDWYPRLRETLGEDVIARIDGAFGLIGPGSRVECAGHRQRIALFQFQPARARQQPDPDPGQRAQAPFACERR